MKTLKNLGHGGLHQGDPTGDEPRDFYGNIVEGYTEEELNRLRQLQREYDKAQMGIVSEGFREFSTESRAQPQDSRRRDIMGYQQSLMREIDNLQREIEVRSGIEDKRLAAAQEEVMRQQRLSKGTPKPGPFELRYGGKTPMSFVKPKSRY
tara:strand:+ start:46 stop:498 length:453 start_codon:yes stop_codon:yes gene_type:complete